MANYETHRVVVRGDTKELERLKTLFLNEGCPDANRVIPMPAGASEEDFKEAWGMGSRNFEGYRELFWTKYRWEFMVDSAWTVPKPVWRELFRDLFPNLEASIAVIDECWNFAFIARFNDTASSDADKDFTELPPCDAISSYCYTKDFDVGENWNKSIYYEMYHIDEGTRGSDFTSRREWDDAMWFSFLKYRLKKNVAEEVTR